MCEVKALKFDRVVLCHTMGWKFISRTCDNVSRLECTLHPKNYVDSSYLVVFGCGWVEVDILTSLEIYLPGTGTIFRYNVEIWANRPHNFIKNKNITKTQINIQISHTYIKWSDKNISNMQPAFNPETNIGVKYSRCCHSEKDMYCLTVYVILLKMKTKISIFHATIDIPSFVQNHSNMACRLNAMSGVFHFMWTQLHSKNIVSYWQNGN